MKKNNSQRTSFPTVFRVQADRQYGQFIIETFYTLMAKHGYGDSITKFLFDVARLLETLDDDGALEKLLKGTSPAEIYGGYAKVRKTVGSHLKTLEQLIAEIEESIKKGKGDELRRVKVIETLASALQKLTSLDRLSVSDIDKELRHQELLRLAIFKNDRIRASQILSELRDEREE